MQQGVWGCLFTFNFVFLRQDQVYQDQDQLPLSRLLEDFISGPCT